MKSASLPLSLYQNTRGLVLAATYSLLCGISLWFSYELRFDFMVPEAERYERITAFFLVIPLKLICLWATGQFRGLLSYFRIPDLNRLFIGLLATGTILLFVRLVEPTGLFSIPRGVLLTDFLLSIILIVAFRIGLRVLREKFSQSVSGIAKEPRRIAIYGAGSTGAALAAEYLAKPHLGVRPVIFLDDDPNKSGKDIHGIPIFGDLEKLHTASGRYEFGTIVIAIPSLNAKRIREILLEANEAKLETTIIPSLHELSSGRVKIEEMRKIEVEDLLGRDPVSLESDTIKNFVSGRVILVSGAGGSIGSEIVRQVSSFNPDRILLVDHSELAVFSIEQEIKDSEMGAPITALVADIADAEMMDKIFRRYRPAVIFHAAAYKHVPLMETQPWEAVANNSLGTLKFAGMAKEYGVERFVLISTDKAINPTSVMGASKRLAEIALQSFYGNGVDKTASENGKTTRFMAVRFGNVLGSSGSVIPTFRRQIARGGPVTVTHPEVTRYFMTIPEAVGLVLQSAALGQGGEIFLLDMGEPVKIIDLARQMIQLSGFVPETEIEIEIVGLRPGEKLFEELNYDTESSEETSHPRIRRLQVRARNSEEVYRWFDALADDLIKLDAMELKDRIKEMVPEYTPYVD